jgi:hypothetical protein
MDRRLAQREFLADDYSIADIAAWPWTRGAQMLYGESFGDFANLKAWFERVGARPAVARGAAIGAEFRRSPADMSRDELARAAKNLFGQTAQSIAAAAQARTQPT